MKNLTLPTLFMLFWYNAMAQPAIQWERTYGGTEEDRAYTIEQTTDGGYITAGNSASDDGDVSGLHGMTDAWIVKLTANGAIQWQKALGGSKDEVVKSIIQTSDGGYLALGNTNSPDGDFSGYHASYDGFVVKLNAVGDVEWKKAMGGPGWDELRSVKQAPDGGFIIVGEAGSNGGDISGNHGFGDVWVIKLAPSGTIQWQKLLGGTNADRGRSVEVTSDGGFIVAGITKSNDGDVIGYVDDHKFDYWLIKLSATGTIEWQVTTGGTDDDWAIAVKQATDGAYILSGYVESFDGDVVGYHGGTSDYWVLKYSATGQMLWKKALGGSDMEWNPDLDITNDGGCVVTGLTGSNDGDVSGFHGYRDYWVVKLNASGEIQWEKAYGGTNCDDGYAVRQTGDGGFILAGGTCSSDGDVGSIHSYDAGDFWIVKLGATLTETVVPGKTALLEIFPNPTAGVVTLKNIQEPILSAMVINILGDELTLHTLGNSASLDVSNLPAGAYHLVVTTRNGLVYASKLYKQN